MQTQSLNTSPDHRIALALSNDGDQVEELSELDLLTKNYDGSNVAEGGVCVSGPDATRGHMDVHIPCLPPTAMQ